MNTALWILEANGSDAKQSVAAWMLAIGHRFSWHEGVPVTMRSAYRSALTRFDFPAE